MRAVFSSLITYILVFASIASATIIKVPEDYTTIQDGIDISVNGDTVMVAPGIYSGSRNRNITTAGKAILVMGEFGALNTIIDCAFDQTGFIISDSEGANTVIAGFTIKNSLKGIFCDGTSPTIKSCIFNDFFAYGVHVDGYSGDPAVSPIIEDCIFEQVSNDYFGWGDGIYGYRAANITISGSKFARCEHGMNYHAYNNLRPYFDITKCLFRNITGNGIWTHS
ncbi:MAG: right-handed parallel beta-helix repeat-containing protein [candidate division Zixibacteria bacterium]